jgi:hypothetical protein
MSRYELHADDGVNWCLLYTKPRAEAWVEANLRKQGFESLLPWTATRGGMAPLFPRYLFAGHRQGQRSQSLAGTYGVQYVVQCAGRPARVPAEVIREIAGRMDARGVVQVETSAQVDPLFAKRQRERLVALEKFAAAGFKVRIA